MLTVKNIYKINYNGTVYTKSPADPDIFADETGTNVSLLGLSTNRQIFGVASFKTDEGEEVSIIGKDGVGIGLTQGGSLTLRTIGRGVVNLQEFKDFLNPPLTPIDYEALTNQILSRYPEKIRLEKTLRRREETLSEFLELFFTEWNDEKDTIYVTSREVYCEKGKRRSLGDLFMICRYYYPGCSLKDVVTILTETLPNALEGFRTSFCSDIRKRVYYYDPTQDTEVLSLNTPDEFGNLYSQYEI